MFISCNEWCLRLFLKEKSTCCTFVLSKIKSDMFRSSFFLFCNFLYTIKTGSQITQNFQHTIRQTWNNIQTALS